MIKIFYRGYPKLKPNTWLGGKLFIGGVCTLDNIEDGIYFANLFHLKYEVIEEKEPKKSTKKTKKVNKND